MRYNSRKGIAVITIQNSKINILNSYIKDKIIIEIDETSNYCFLWTYDMEMMLNDRLYLLIGRYISICQDMNYCFCK